MNLKLGDVSDREKERNFEYEGRVINGWKQEVLKLGCQVEEDLWM